MADIDAEVHAAKAYLLQTSNNSNTNLYDHLCECLSRVIDEKPQDVVDYIEEVSRAVKRERVQPQADVLQEPQAPSVQVEVAQLQKPLFQASDTGDDVDDEDEVSIPFPDLMDTMSCFEQGGIGLNKEETYQILLALKQLTKSEPLASVRFWGKIFGTNANYIIAEAEYQEGEGEQKEEEEDEEEEEDGGEKAEKEGGEEDAEEEEEKDEPPKSQWKPPPKIPQEEPKAGTNKRTYFVCNQPGEKWVKLPHVTPAQIVAAREIKKLFTGNLSTPILTYPPFPDNKGKFPGKEENYLRAQIARISGTTQVSPAGYYQFEEGEDDEEEEGSGVIEVNKEFEIAKITEYADGSMNNWVHHSQYILPQGRCLWFNPVQKADDEFDDEEDEEEKEEPDEPEPENGPKLLTSVAEDATVNGLPAWTAKLSSNVVPQYAAAIISSNLWPGAHAFAVQKKFENIYIGWGQRYRQAAYNPNLPPSVQEEFPAGPEIEECSDPTVEEESAAKKAQEDAEAAQDQEEDPDDDSDDD